jgi:hypothetical protein
MCDFNFGGGETPYHLLEKTLLKNVGLPIVSFDFGSCGGYPSELLEWMCDIAPIYQ